MCGLGKRSEDRGISLEVLHQHLDMVLELKRVLNTIENEFKKNRHQPRPPFVSIFQHPLPTSTSTPGTPYSTSPHLLSPSPPSSLQLPTLHGEMPTESAPIPAQTTASTSMRKIVMGLGYGEGRKSPNMNSSLSVNVKKA